MSRNDRLGQSPWSAPVPSRGLFWVKRPCLKQAESLSTLLFAHQDACEVGFCGYLEFNLFEAINTEGLASVLRLRHGKATNARAGDLSGKIFTTTKRFMWKMGQALGLHTAGVKANSATFEDEALA